VSSSVDVAGRRRSPATFSEFHLGRSPRNKGMRYPADPPTVEEIVAVMRAAGDGLAGDRIRGLIVVLWRAGPGSRRRSTSTGATSTGAAARCSSAAARAAIGARSGWTTGAGST
jgi:hypothetical protein